MKREIKFRAWNKAINSMGSALPLRIWTDDIATDIGRDKYLKDKDNIVIMQFTGLRDKNGMEIYESDILLICHDFKGRTNRGKIIFKDGKFQLEGFCMTHLDNPNDFTECLEYATVIGNIYTTPELITTP